MATVQMKLDEWVRLMAEAKSNEERASIQGYSPGGAAAELGMTRQGVYEAEKRGNLDCIRVYDRAGHMLFVMLTEASVERLKQRRKAYTPSQRASARIAGLTI